MDSERWRQVSQIFHELLEQESNNRASFLDRVCAGDRSLYEEVETLLRSHEQAAAAFSESAKREDPITTGSRIGAYEVTSSLGEGGMGVVFRARDVVLQREVALKVLPEHFAGDLGRLVLLQREAQVLAALNHPNIAQIYGFEQAASSGCIVMEFVEGQTLADRLKTGALPLDEAIEISRQIVDALQAAHKRGIVHRDLKPANITVARTGRVKVLDFGLAKFVGEAASADFPNSTTDLNGSLPRLVMGTASYMSPEQARGKTVDARTDVWAFGCVFYEMLTGCQAFPGKTIAEVIARIIEGTLDWDLLPVATPPAIRMLIEATLNKDPQQRLQHIGDTRVFLNQMSSIPALSRAAKNRTWRWKPAAAGTLIVLVTLLTAASTYLRPQATAAPEIRFQIAAQGIRNPSLTVSPDGQHIAYVAPVAGGRPSIWIRAIGAVTAQSLPGTENAGNGLFWSPGGDYLGFFADGKLKTISVAGGAPKVLTNADTWAVNSPVAWNRAGVFLMAAHFTGLAPGLYRHSQREGPPVRVTNPDPARGESGHFYPQFLPDGRHFLYYAPTAIDGGVGAAGGGAVYVASLDSKHTIHLMDIGGQPLSDAPPIYVEPGYLLFGRNRSLMVQRFDTQKLTLVGDAIPIAEQVIGRSFSASADVLAYRPSTPGTPLNNSRLNQLSWFDRNGKPIGLSGSSGLYSTLDLSPDGRRLAVELSTDSNRDITVIDLEGNISRRLTFDAAVDRTPVFTSDGSRIIFSSGRAGSNNLGYSLFQRASDGSGADRLLFSGDHGELVFPEDVSSDGRHLVFTRYRTSFDLWVLPLSGGGKPFLFREAAGGAQVSPDGRWLAYNTWESGIHQVYVQTFPDPNGGRWQVSSKGGVGPKWRNDGKELYFLALDGKFMAVPVKADLSFEFDTPAPLFQSQYILPPSGATSIRHDVTPDGQRFVMVTPVSSPGSDTSNPHDEAPVTVIINWTSALENRD